MRIQGIWSKSKEFWELKKGISISSCGSTWLVYQLSRLCYYYTRGLLHKTFYRRKLWLKLKTRVSMILPLTLTQEKTQVKNNLSFLRLRVLCNRPQAAQTSSIKTSNATLIPVGEKKKMLQLTCLATQINICMEHTLYILIMIVLPVKSLHWILKQHCQCATLQLCAWRTLCCILYSASQKKGNP